MDYSSIIKKVLNALPIVLIVIFVVLLCASIVFLPILGRIAIMIGLASGPYNHPGSIWTSEEPEIYLQVSSHHSAEDTFGYVMADGEKIPVDIGVQPDRPWVFITPKDGSYNHQLRGGLIECTKNKVVFKVEEDNLFDGKYEIITLVRQK